MLEDASANTKLTWKEEVEGRGSRAELKKKRSDEDGMKEGGGGYWIGQMGAKVGAAVGRAGKEEALRGAPVAHSGILARRRRTLDGRGRRSKEQLSVMSGGD